MIFKTKKLERSVVFLNETRDGIVSYCKINHPDEMILILKGHSKKGKMFVESLVVPPFNETAPTFAGFPSNQLPFDADYIGMAHSHPIGTAEPSLEDLNNFFGLVSIIVKSPYEDEDILAWDSSGNSIPILDE
ncbi:Mov34/MPN/PAD-1 family protein [Candidatus Nitrosopelagicus sp.]|nr:Mov34/MPN/PAD-1 family protein [Candidatus Nitrosopelagicus sp.]|tara:strand:- start:203 stop:601 length:399 start_codon:yes stop_codon:yes gene_type:complete